MDSQDNVDDTNTQDIALEESVKVHRGNEAETAANKLGAREMTMDESVFINDEYDATSNASGLYMHEKIHENIDNSDVNDSFYSGENTIDALDAYMDEIRPVSMKDAIIQFSEDRDVLRSQDPNAELTVTQAANHPEAEAMFVRLHEAGVENMPASALEGETVEERVENLLLQAQDVDNNLEREASQDASAEQNLPYVEHTSDNELDYGL